MGRGQNCLNYLKAYRTVTHPARYDNKPYQRDWKRSDYACHRDAEKRLLHGRQHPPANLVGVLPGRSDYGSLKDENRGRYEDRREMKCADKNERVHVKLGGSRDCSRLPCLSLGSDLKREVALGLMGIDRSDSPFHLVCPVAKLRQADDEEHGIF
jgi:hypothetical protein